MIKKISNIEFYKGYNRGVEVSFTRGGEYHEDHDSLEISPYLNELKKLRWDLKKLKRKDGGVIELLFKASSYDIECSLEINNYPLEIFTYVITHLSEKEHKVSISFLSEGEKKPIKIESRYPYLDILFHRLKELRITNILHHDESLLLENIIFDIEEPLRRELNSINSTLIYLLEGYLKQTILIKRGDSSEERKIILNYAAVGDE